AIQQRAMQEQGQMVLATGPNPAMQEQAQEIVDLAQVWNRLDKNSKAWTLLIDNDAKVRTVSEYIERYRARGVKISKPPAHYAKMLDDMTRQDPQALLQPFGQILQMMAIMEYDLDNGMDREMMAQRLLGPQGYISNKKRLGR